VSCGEHLRTHHWDFVFSSDLPRAHNTAQLILSNHAGHHKKKHNVLKTKLLREIHFGVREGLSRAYSVAEARAIVAQRLGVPLSEVVDSKESLPEVRARQISFLTHLKFYLCALALQSSLSSEAGRSSGAGTGAALGAAGSDLDNSGSAPDGAQRNATAVHVMCTSHGGFIKDFLRNFCPGLEKIEKIGNCSVSVVDVEFDALELEEAHIAVIQQLASIDDIDIDIDKTSDSSCTGPVFSTTPDAATTPSATSATSETADPEPLCEEDEERGGKSNKLVKLWNRLGRFGPVKDEIARITAAALRTSNGSKSQDGSHEHSGELPFRCTPVIDLTNVSAEKVVLHAAAHTGAFSNAA
jgi:broad specificity phosphatase PhoE